MPSFRVFAFLWAASLPLCLSCQPTLAQNATPENALRFVPPIGHGAEVNAVAYSMDGRYAASGAEDKTVRVWEVSTGRELRQFSGHEKDVTAVAFSPDGQTVASASDDGTVRLWELASGHEVRQLPQQETEIKSVAFSPDGKYLLSGSKTVQLWEAATARLVSTFAHETELGFIAALGVTFSRDGKYALAGFNDNTTEIWEVAGGRRLPTPGGYASEVSCVAFSPDCKYAVAGSYDKTIRLWEVASGRAVRSFSGAAGEVATVAFSPDGKYLVSGGWDSAMRLWDVATGRQVRLLNESTAEINSAVFSPDGKYILSGAWNKVVRLWDVASACPVRNFGGFIAGITTAAISRDGKYALQGSWGSKVRLWELASGRQLHTFEGHQGGVTAVAFSADGKQALSGSDDGTMRLWDVASGRELRRFTLPEEIINAVALSPDGKYALSGGQEGSLILWDAATGRQVRALAGHKAAVRAVAFSPDGKWIVSGAEPDWGGPREGSKADTVRLWDAATGQLVRRYEGHEKWPVDTVAFSPDGKTIASGGRDKTIWLWDAATGRELRRMAHEHFVFSVSFSPDGKQLASGSWDGTARLWDVNTGKETRRFSGHSFYVDAVVFAPDGKYVLSGSHDGTSKLWEVATGREVFTYITFDQGDWIAYTRDGRFDGSPGGMQKVYFAKGLQTYALEQFAERFYTPGLVELLLHGEAAPLPEQPTVQVAVAQGAPPLVSIAAPVGGTVNQERLEVMVEVAEQEGGGVKAVRLYHNDRLVGGPAELRGIVVEAAQPKDGLTKRFTLDLTPGENRLRAVAYSRTDLESRPAEVTVRYNAPELAKPTLHVLSVGINVYEDATMNLSYARPDAEAVSKFFEQQGKAANLFGEVRGTLLVDTGATGAAIKNALTQIGAQSKPEDVVFIYLAGHGETAPLKDEANSEETFFFLPHEMRQLAMPERVRQYGLSKPDLDALLGVATMKARKIVLIYDACKSGAAVAGGIRGVADEQKALASLARAQGIHVLTASTAQQYAAEVKALGHGILTYAVLEGLGGKAAANGMVQVLGLTEYVDDRVPQLTDEYRSQRQYPVHFSKGQNFPLVRQR